LILLDPLNRKHIAFDFQTGGPQIVFDVAVRSGRSNWSTDLVERLVAAPTPNLVQIAPVLIILQDSVYFRDRIQLFKVNQKQNFGVNFACQFRK
jgi:hypothetical protein